MTLSRAGAERMRGDACAGARGRFGVLAVLLAVAILACGRGRDRLPAGPREFLDARGDSVALMAMPRRVVVLAPSLVEIVAEIGGESQIVAVADHSDFPLRLRRLPRVGSYYTPNIEAIVSARPDLVIALDNNGVRVAATRLRALGIPVAICRAERTEDISASMELIGRMLGVESTSIPSANRFLRRYRAVRDSVTGCTRPSVYLAMGDDGLRTVGSSSYIHSLITDAGGENIAGDVAEGYPRFALEMILHRAPDIILFAGDPDSAGFLASRRRAWSRWPMIPAVRNDRLAVVDRELMLRPGPRVVEGLAEFAKALHPERGREIERALSLP